MFRRCKIFLIVALILLPPFRAAAEGLPNRIEIERGVEKFVPLEAPIRRISIGDTGVLDVSVIDGSTLRILGLKPGRTTFSIWRDSGAVPDTYEAIILDGLSALTERLAASSDSDARASEIDGKIVLEGRFPDAAAQSDARALAKFISGKDPLDLSAVSANQSVEVEVEVISVSQTALKGFGFDLGKLDRGFAFSSTPPNALRSFALNQNGNVGLTVEQTAPIASAFNLLLGSPRYNALAVISALESSNFAQTLAKPRLVVRSGDKATFLVGGEIPIPVPQGGTTNAITIEYKRFGVSLNMEATILKDRRIAMKLKPAVSELDFSNAISLQGYTVPAIKTRETETTVELTQDEPFIIAGLMFDAGTTVNEKVPYLADVPILGKFFQRASATHEEQELMIAVIPHLVTSNSQDESPRAEIKDNLKTVFPEVPSLSGPLSFSKPQTRALQ